MLRMPSVEWLHRLNLYFWSLLCILALISTAPILSKRTIPKRVKLGLGLIITVVIAPSIPVVNVPIFSVGTLWQAMQQILIGIALGLTMQFAFAAICAAGGLIDLQVDLSFVTFFDSGSRLSMLALARLTDMFTTLLFLTFNDHLWLISLLVDTSHTLPIGGNLVNSSTPLALARAGSLTFLSGLMLALPVMTLLLMLNLALGLLNRTVPQLPVFIIGFPLTLTVGISPMAALMPLIVPLHERLFSEIPNLLANIVSEMPGKR